MHTLNRSHIILDVAGLGDIDEDQVAGARIEWPEALLHDLPYLIYADDRVWRGGAGYDDIGERDVAVEVFEVDGSPAYLLSKLHCTPVRPVGDVDGGQVFGSKRLGHQKPHLSAPDDQDVAVAQGAEELFSKRHGCRTDRDRPPVDLCLAPDPDPDMHRLVYAELYGTACGSRLFRYCKRLLQLPEDLVLADDQGVDAGSKFQEVTGHIHAPEDEKVLPSLLPQECFQASSIAFHQNFDAVTGLEQ